MCILSNAQAAQRLLDSKRPDLTEIREILADIVDEAERAGRLMRQGVRVSGVATGSRTHKTSHL
jgi:hypothetical protein